MQCNYMYQKLSGSQHSSSRLGLLVFSVSNLGPCWLISFSKLINLLINNYLVGCFIFILNAPNWSFISTIIILDQDLYIVWNLFLDIHITGNGHSWCSPFDTAWEMHVWSLFFLHRPYDLAARLLGCTTPAQASVLSLFSLKCIRISPFAILWSEAWLFPLSCSSS